MSDSVKKTIQINPELFKVSSSGSKSKKPRNYTQKKRPVQRSNPLKKELLSKIKSHAQKNKKTIKEKKDFATSFEEHMDYLNNLVQKQKKINIHTELPNELKKHSQTITNIPPAPAAPAVPVPAVPVPVSTSHVPASHVPVVSTSHVPVSAVSTSHVSASHVSASHVPASHVPASHVPASHVPASHVPASHVPASHVPAVSTSHVPAVSTSHVPVPASHVPAVPTSHVPASHVPASHVPAVSASFNSDPMLLEKASFSLKNDPPYGNLKIGGKKPTFRSWSRTKKVHHVTHIPIIERTQQIKKKFSLGRNKSSNRVTVFLKNNKTRRKINDEISAIQQKPIVEIKEYLRKHNLIKIGSEAPSDVLRKLYKETLLAGDIKNSNTNTLIHNYLSEDNDDK